MRFRNEKYPLLSEFDKTSHQKSEDRSDILPQDDDNLPESKRAG